jgi:hypothetical protein
LLFTWHLRNTQSHFWLKWRRLLQINFQIWLFFFIAFLGFLLFGFYLRCLIFTLIFYGLWYNYLCNFLRLLLFNLWPTNLTRIQPLLFTLWNIKGFGVTKWILLLSFIFFNPFIRLQLLFLKIFVCLCRLWFPFNPDFCIFNTFLRRYTRNNFIHFFFQ